MESKMYLSLEEAVTELEKRQQDEDLKNRVSAVLGKSCPIPRGKVGIILRQIATSRYEDILFKNRCIANGIEPVWMEYHQDEFRMSNPSKSRMVKLRFHEGVGKNGGLKMHHHKVIKDFGKWEGKPIGEIKTDWGENLVSFHHRMRRGLGWNFQTIDASSWIKDGAGGKAEKYYRILFSAFITHGILFESFESPGFSELEKFKRRVVIPAWEWACLRFPKPLVVLHPDKGIPSREEKMLNWYPGVLANFVKSN